MRLGILGGTFDPIHYGHLFIAEEARVQFGLDQIVFIPSGHPPHKRHIAVTAAQSRYIMTQLGTQDNSYFCCSSLEIDRKGLSFTVDTLAALREQIPEADLYYITGIDAIAEILTWKEPEQVVRAATFIAATRPGFDLAQLQTRLPTFYLDRILMLRTTALNISSTEIRQRIQENRSARYLTPDSVLQYIEDHQLYSANKETLQEA